MPKFIVLLFILGAFLPLIETVNVKFPPRQLPNQNNTLINREVPNRPPYNPPIRRNNMVVTSPLMKIVQNTTSPNNRNRPTSVPSRKEPARYPPRQRAPNSPSMAQRHPPRQRTPNTPLVAQRRGGGVLPSPLVQPRNQTTNRRSNSPKINPGNRQLMPNLPAKDFHPTTVKPMTPKNDHPVKKNPLPHIINRIIKAAIGPRSDIAASSNVVEIFYPPPFEPSTNETNEIPSYSNDTFQYVYKEYVDELNQNLTKEREEEEKAIAAYSTTSLRPISVLDFEPVQRLKSGEISSRNAIYVLADAVKITDNLSKHLVEIIKQNVTAQKEIPAVKVPVSTKKNNWSDRSNSIVKNVKPKPNFIGSEKFRNIGKITTESNLPTLRYDNYEVPNYFSTAEKLSPITTKAPVLTNNFEETPIESIVISELSDDEINMVAQAMPAVAMRNLMETFTQSLPTTERNLFDKNGYTEKFSTTSGTAVLSSDFEDVKNLKNTDVSYISTKAIPEALPTMELPMAFIKNPTESTSEKTEIQRPEITSNNSVLSQGFKDGALKIPEIIEPNEKINSEEIKQAPGLAVKEETEAENIRNIPITMEQPSLTKTEFSSKTPEIRLDVGLTQKDLSTGLKKGPVKVIEERFTTETSEIRRDNGPAPKEKSSDLSLDYFKDDQQNVREKISTPEIREIGSDVGPTPKGTSDLSLDFKEDRKIHEKLSTTEKPKIRSGVDLPPSSIDFKEDPVLEIISTTSILSPDFKEDPLRVLEKIDITNLSDAEINAVAEGLPAVEPTTETSKKEEEKTSTTEKPKIRSGVDLPPSPIDFKEDPLKVLEIISTTVKPEIRSVVVPTFKDTSPSILSTVIKEDPLKVLHKIDITNLSDGEINAVAEGLPAVEPTTEASKKEEEKVFIVYAQSIREYLDEINREARTEKVLITALDEKEDARLKAEAENKIIITPVDEKTDKKAEKLSKDYIVEKVNQNLDQGENKIVGSNREEEIQIEVSQPLQQLSA